MIVGLTASVPGSIYQGLTTHGVPTVIAAHLSHLPAIGYLFAAFLGYNPLKSELGSSILNKIKPADAARLISKEYFPKLIGVPFKHGLTVVLTFAIIACLVAAFASWLRGGKFINEES